jgi:Mg2+-importing ATPase
MSSDIDFWSRLQQDVLRDAGTSLAGLTDQEAALRKSAKMRSRPAWLNDLILLVSQFRNPLTFLLLFALIISAFLKEFRESSIIFSILLVSGLLSFFQERKAGRAVEQLRLLLKTKATVRRENRMVDILLEEVVRGDIVILKAGDIVPADGLILESKDLYANESVLTGESFPAEKKTGLVPADTLLSKRTNAVFKGTSIISGTATIVALYTGRQSLLGQMELELKAPREETAFERGIRQFGYMLMRVAIVMAVIIMIVNISLGKPALDSILFALALSIGLAPELLPAIITITLSAGARRLADRKVIVKRLSSIQNLGAIDVLCADKTGTLTEGTVKVHSFVNASGQEDEQVKRYAYLNAFYESGYPNPMDMAIREQAAMDINLYAKSDEVPYDFLRKRLSIVVKYEQQQILIAKGALKNILDVCKWVQMPDGRLADSRLHQQHIQDLFKQYSGQGLRTIGIAWKDVTNDPVITKDDEVELIFLGFALLHDPPRMEAKQIIQALKDNQVAVKIITGDNALVAMSIAQQLDIPARILSGKDLRQMNDDALFNRVDDITIFAETEPNQKERIVLTLQKKGHVVGYIGDGINDASAIKTADVGISVNTAVDVAREAADMILLENTLEVMREGIMEGRKTYINTLKYIFITISANFGNMLSMAGISLFIPFLPLLPSQVLLTNLLSDIPALTIASDQVDPEMLRKPRRWNTRFIRLFMVVFGLESSLFDFLTFAALIFYFRASPGGFQTGWFVESVLTEIMILLIIRTRRTFFKSKIGRSLLISSVLVVVLIVLLPYLPISGLFGFVPLPPRFMMAICLIAILYGLFAESTKKILFRKINY